ncbi:MAG: hypothetical protein ACREH8_17435, partial [Opitutaceae bacterium]
MSHKRSSRDRYRAFLSDYKRRRLDNAGAAADDPAAEQGARERRGKRREYLRDYLRWLRPHRTAIGAVFIFAVIAAGLTMLEPLFMRFIIDRILLNPELDSASRLSRLNVIGAVFLGVIVLSNLVDALKDYRQRLLNVRVMISLRRSLFHRLLHPPLSRVW